MKINSAIKILEEARSGALIELRIGNTGLGSVYYVKTAFSEFISTEHGYESNMSEMETLFNSYKKLDITASLKEIKKGQTITL